jgi:hypothetical protein
MSRRGLATEHNKRRHIAEHIEGAKFRVCSVSGVHSINRFLRHTNPKRDYSLTHIATIGLDEAGLKKAHASPSKN